MTRFQNLANGFLITLPFFVSSQAQGLLMSFFFSFPPFIHLTFFSSFLFLSPCSDWTIYDCTSFTCTPPSTGFLAGLENRALEYVCVALAPVPFNLASDLAIPGKYESTFRGCNVVGKDGSGRDVEISHPKFAILNNITSSFVWGPPIWPGASRVTYPGMTVQGTSVTICRTYRTSTAVHSGYVVNNVCVYSFGGSAAASLPGAYDSLWNISGTIPPSSIPITPLPSTLPTPSPSLSSTRSVTSSQTPSPSSTPAVAGSSEIWIDRTYALSLGYDKSAFVQSGTDNYGLDQIFVCRGELQNGFTGPIISSTTSSTATISGPMPLAFRLNVDTVITLSNFTPSIPTAGIVRISIDEVNRRAFIIQRNTNAVLVIDLNTGSILSRIALLSSPTDVLVVSSMNLVLISSNTGNSVTSYSSTNLSLIWTNTNLPSASSLDVDLTLKVVFVATGGKIVKVDLTSGESTTSSS
jgi:hypothetical protein